MNSSATSGFQSQASVYSSAPVRAVGEYFESRPEFLGLMVHDSEQTPMIEPTVESGMHRFDFWSKAPYNVTILIKNVDGEFLHKRRRKIIGGLNKIRIDLSQFPSGNYQLILLENEWMGSWMFRC